MPGIYLHIPFCKRRCLYCDFFSSTRSELKARYIEALCQELQFRSEYLPSGSLIETIYFGGGTPSQLTPREIEQILSYIYKVYKVAEGAEITLESNPDDLTPEYVNELRRLSINRLSMGIQTFNDNALQLLHRRHSARQAVEAVKRCQDAGFGNISIDLMYGLPGETTEQWAHDISQAIALGVQHISAYHLTYEEGTPLWQLLERGDVTETDEETSRIFYTMLTERLKQAGYEHYEISNFCLPNLHSRHNSSYWQGKSYLGCGAAAHSYDGTSRQWNIASLTDYIEGITTRRPRFEREELDRFTQYNDCIVTRLRTVWGVSLDDICLRFGDDLLQHCLACAAPHIRQGMLQINNNTLSLSAKGVFLSDGIMSDLLWV